MVVLAPSCSVTFSSFPFQVYPINFALRITFSMKGLIMNNHGNTETSINQLKTAVEKEASEKIDWKR